MKWDDHCVLKESAEGRPRFHERGGAALIGKVITRTQHSVLQHGFSSPGRHYYPDWGIPH